MKILVCLILMFVGMSVSVMMAMETEPSGKKIILVTPPQNRGDVDAKKVARTDSEKAADGGYLANPDLLHCFAEMKYYYTGGRYENHPVMFCLRMPEKIKPGKTYPLIIWLHGVGEGTGDNRRHLAHLQSMFDSLAGEESVDFYLLATQCPADNNSWTNSVSHEGKGDAPMTINKEIVDALLGEYPIDRGRISVAGVSSGGSMTWEYASRYPEFFAAILPLSSGPPSCSPATFKDMAVWAFNNKYDNQAPWKSVKEYVKHINASGGRAYQTVNLTSSSHDTWTEAMRIHKAVVWLTLQKKGNRLGPPPGSVCYFRPYHKTFFMFILPIGLLVAMVWLRRKKYLTKKDQNEITHNI